MRESPYLFSCHLICPFIYDGPPNGKVFRCIANEADSRRLLFQQGGCHII